LVGRSSKKVGLWVRTLTLPHDKLEVPVLTSNKLVITASFICQVTGFLPTSRRIIFHISSRVFPVTSVSFFFFHDVMGRRRER
jgi:hypothetical protein